MSVRGKHGINLLHDPDDTFAALIHLAIVQRSLLIRYRVIPWGFAAAPLSMPF
jgi:hypothetical protein